MKKSKFTEAQMIKVLKSQEEGKKVSQICREFGISEPTFYNWKRVKKRRYDDPANPIAVSLKENVDWAMDFMTDVLVNSNIFCILNIVDQFNRKCLTIEIQPSMPAWRVINTLNQVIEKYGKPLGIRTDNGPEFTSHLFQSWLEETGVQWVKIQKGKPQQNAIIERFNRTYREDILDANLFRTLDNVRDLTQTWMEEYNNERPHEALNYQTPSEYAA
jgi:putative transposase